MAFQIWQVGLDIQNGQICALSVQRRRNGWQLRHWWQHALPQDTLRNGLVQRSELLIVLLRQWRKRLPQRISLRLGFPPQLIMQHRLPLPAMTLREPEQAGYVRAAARQVFPLEPDALAMDYRFTAPQRDALCLTAARQDSLESWLNCLNQAGLTANIVELTPAALAVVAQALAVETHAVLVHRLSDHWLWYGQALGEEQWGWCPHSECPDFAALQRQYLSAAGPIWYSSALAETAPSGTRLLSPLAAIPLFQPPLPACSTAFTLATGLALREPDC